MDYTHRMLPLPESYDQAATEKKWQAHWLNAKTYAWNPDAAREDSYVIDTPPPTVSGTLHMGHVFSYTQADFIARYQRMTGKNVFYPMGFDDNGLPTERLVEKTKKIRAGDMSREAFIEECLSVSEEARREFRSLFESIALSVDWDQEYHTISDDSRRLSQLSFLDLVHKGHCYRAQRPFYWDPVDQTAIASAEIEDKELPSFANEVVFRIINNSPLAGESTSASESVGGQASAKHPPTDSASLSSQNPAPPQGESSELIIMTTRPELLPACVALFYHPEDARYTHLKGKHAEVPLFGFMVPILADDTVDMEKGTGLMMCCTFGDDADIAKWQKHQLPIRVVINKYGKMDFTGVRKDAIEASVIASDSEAIQQKENTSTADAAHWIASSQAPRNDVAYELLQNKKVSNADPKHPGARQIVIEMLKEAGLLVSSKPITHAVKCAERSGAPLEILPTSQWFVAVTDKKNALNARARECRWNPDWMRLRIEQWIDGLNQDWCISRQRYFGVPFPVWYALDEKNNIRTIVAKASDLPVNPLTKAPSGMEMVINPTLVNNDIADGMTCVAHEDIFDINGELVFKGDGFTHYKLMPDPDVMDTWATSSISPQLSAGAISANSPLVGESQRAQRDAVGGQNSTEYPPTDSASFHSQNPAPPQGGSRFQKLFPADLRPQAHEIIRTWAFYTLVKAHLHNDSVPWHNLMISGWCLAEDKSKMSKSKGNVVTPVALIEERGTDAVRYWAATSRLGMDTAFSPDLLKIGKKLVGKLWNATQFAAIHLSKLNAKPSTAATDTAITETLDKWILSRLHETIVKATHAFDAYEYADALDATNQFFWSDFCDNYLELIKKRVYNEPVIPGLSRDLPPHTVQQASGDPGMRRDDSPFSATAQQSAVRTLYYVLEGILKLYAPFVPHVTEELYAHIFADDYEARGSLHAQSQWPLSAHYFMDTHALEAGKLALVLLEVIRKHKSDAKRSIKAQVTHVKFRLTQEQLSLADSIEADVMGAGNIVAIEWELPSGNAEHHEITLAPEADAA